MFYPIGLMWAYIQPKGEGKVNLRKEKKNCLPIGKMHGVIN